ncbi:MAG: hypothetical protein OQK82_09020 [Candidatus Pacearchaeota archaeon]|nr:hypothetical protein [Candidatus Pacearchaeota archaeon]
MDKQLIKDYSWIVSGSQRLKILNILNKVRTPKEISTETKLKFSNVSDVLTAMVKRNIIECLNPKNHTGRLYKLTKKGEKIKSQISK